VPTLPQKNNFADAKAKPVMKLNERDYPTKRMCGVCDERIGLQILAMHKERLMHLP
jgi:hypothetical protein